jgi:tetraacyldisaccharide 4'-kinase
MDAQWALVQAVVIMGPGEPGRQVAAAARGLPVLHAALRPAADSERLKGRRVYAFAGIGRPEKFFESLRTLGAEVVRSRSFGDHRPYTARIIAGLQEEAGTRGLTLVTTEKDMARIRPVVPADVADHIEVLEVAAVFEEPDALEHLILPVFSPA